MADPELKTKASHGRRAKKEAEGDERGPSRDADGDGGGDGHHGESHHSGSGSGHKEHGSGERRRRRDVDPDREGRDREGSPQRSRRDREDKDRDRDRDGHGRKGARSGGWSTEMTEEQKQRKEREEQKKLEEMDRHYRDDDDGGGAGAIPSLDGPAEEKNDEEDFTRRVAEAPRNYNTSVMAPQELDREGALRLPDAGTVDVDFSILNNCLMKREMRETYDTIGEEWMPEDLFHTLAIQLQREKDEKAEEGEEGKKSEINAP